MGRKAAAIRGGSAHFRSAPSVAYLFVDASEVDGHAELVVLHLGPGYVLRLLYQPLMHLKKHHA